MSIEFTDHSEIRRLTLKLRRRALWRGAVCTGLTLGIGGWIGAEDGPNSSLYSGRMSAMARLVRQPGAGETLPPPLPAPPQAGASFPITPAPTGWYETPLPPPKEVKVHDIITIRVDTGARVSTSAQMQSRRTAQYDARLNDWIVLKGLRAVKPSPQSDGDPRVQGNLNQLDRATGQLDTTESLKFDIAATVAAVLPNGNLVLEAHNTVLNNEEKWMHSLSGICRREDVGPGNIVLSKDIANLQVEKREVGQIHDSYKRGWFTRWFDLVDPF